MPLEPNSSKLQHFQELLRVQVICYICRPPYFLPPKMNQTSFETLAAPPNKRPNPAACGNLILLPCPLGNLANKVIGAILNKTTKRDEFLHDKLIILSRYIPLKRETSTNTFFGGTNTAQANLGSEQQTT